MYVIVRLIKGYQKPLIYKIPQNFKNNISVGSIINVPLRKKDLPAMVLNICQTLSHKNNFEIKEINKIQEFPDDICYQSFIDKISEFYFLDKLFFYKRLRSFLLKNNFSDLVLNQLEEKYKSVTNLTSEQQKVYDDIKGLIEKPELKPILLWGVTGSGKTEIYKKLILDSIKSKKSVILLLPEVSLSLQFEFLLKNSIGDKVEIFGFHSATKQSEKNILWQKLLSNSSVLIIGVHLPILLPINNLGLIIVDEEHEVGFEEKKEPKLNSKQVALIRSHVYNIPIILGSATPSINSLLSVENKRWNILKLENRYAGNFPEIKVLNLTEKTGKRKKNFWISVYLENAIKDRLAKKEQVLIYINRRGYSFFVQCKSCGYVFQCPNCSVSLTLHFNENKMGQCLCCHYCNYSQKYPDNCPDCKTDNKNFIKKGIGTQQAVDILQEIFPKAKIERADLDTTKKKREWAKVVENFSKGEIDILVGTQTITKGYHFPKVTLVGVLWADLNIHKPVFNACETEIQKLIQVSGRAGRESEKSEVVIQVIKDNPIFKNLNEKDYFNFCQTELEFRKMANYPPYCRLVQIIIKNENSEILEKEAFAFVEEIENINQKNNLDLTILGPAKPMVYKISSIESRQVFIKTDFFSKINFLTKEIDLNKFKSKIYILPVG